MLTCQPLTHLINPFYPFYDCSFSVERLSLFCWVFWRIFVHFLFMGMPYSVITIMNINSFKHLFMPMVMDGWFILSFEDKLFCPCLMLFRIQLANYIYTVDSHYKEHTSKSWNINKVISPGPKV